MGLNQFLNQLENGFVKNWSLDRNPINNVNVKTFNEEPIIELKDYTIAYQWNKLNKEVKKVKINDKTYFCTPSSDTKKKLCTSECMEHFEKISQPDWNTYDEFLEHAFHEIRYVEINEENWKLSKCSCYYWCKYYRCKHMIAICERANKFNFPPEAKLIPIGENRKRGN